MKVDARKVQDTTFCTVYLQLKDHIEPCPFCGSDDIALEHTWTASYWMECQGCGAQVHARNRPSKRGDNEDPKAHLTSAKAALRSWNKRAP